MELYSHVAWNDDNFESDSDESVSSTGDKKGSSDTEDSRQTSDAVDNPEKLSDRQVLEAVNKLLKVSGYLYHFSAVQNFCGHRWIGGLYVTVIHACGQSAHSANCALQLHTAQM